MEFLLLILFWIVIPLSPLIWPTFFLNFLGIKRQFSLKLLFVGVTVECLPLGLVVFFYVQPDYEIHFVLPQGFRGGFAIVEDRNGVALKSERGTYVVNVPPSRLVKVRSFKPFQYWHSESWETMDENGVAIAGDAKNGTLDNVVAVRGLGCETRGNNDSRIKYFLGTEAEAEVGFDAFAILVK